MKATIIIPTTGDRGPLLPHAVGSVLGQTAQDLQVIIIGDGLDRPSAAIADELSDRHSVVEFVDLPKGDRRGERQRHEVIDELATGEILTYLCDRDLYLPWHVETMVSLLKEADLAHTLRFRVGTADELIPGQFPDIAEIRTREPGWSRIPLSFAGHRRDFYERLPHGWRTTPEEWGTDTYMWDQMLREPSCRFASIARPSVLTFKRGPHPGWPTADRRQILERWQPRLNEPGLEYELMIGLLDAHAKQSAPTRTSPRRRIKNTVNGLRVNASRVMQSRR